MPVPEGFDGHTNLFGFSIEEFPDQSDLLNESIILTSKGSPRTRGQLDQLRDKVTAEKPDEKHVAGGREGGTGKEMKEYFIRAFRQKAFGNTTKWSRRSDLTFENVNSGKLSHHNTVTTGADGHPIKRELDALRWIHILTGEPVYWVAKDDPSLTIHLFNPDDYEW